MKTSSAKAKGKRLQNKVRDLILERFSQLEPDDVRSTGMGQSGTDIQLSPLARKLFPYSIECKNQEKINIWASWRQAVANTKEGTRPLLVFTRNRSEELVTMRVSDFMDLVDK